MAWLGVASLALSEVWPAIPNSYALWVLFVIAAPPLYVAIEWLAVRLFSNIYGRFGQARKFSLARIGVALTAAIVVVAVDVWMASVFK